MSYYSYIPHDVWCTIGSKLDFFWDRVRFRAVCKSWRSLLPPPCHPPCLLLPASVGYTEIPPRRHIMCLGKQEIYKVEFPEIHGARCIGSAGNWLISYHDDKTIRLTNLFSRVQTHHLRDDGLTIEIDGFAKVVLSSPLSDGRNCGAMALHDNWDKLALARPGDTSAWTDVPLGQIHTIDDIIFYKQHFYAVNGRSLLVCDIGDDLNPPRLLDIANIDEFLDYDSKISTHYCLVELLGELLVIEFIHHINSVDDDRYRTDWIKMYKLDCNNMKLQVLKSLGEHSLFLGYSGTCVSVLASDYFGLVKKNSIYFIEQRNDGDDARVFDLEGQGFSPCYEHIQSIPPPVWIVPTPNPNNEVSTTNTLL